MIACDIWHICKYSSQWKYFFNLYLGSHNVKNLIGNKCNSWKERLMFPHHSKGHLMFFTSIWYFSNICNSLFTNSLVGSLVLIDISKMSSLASSSIYIPTTTPNSTIGCKIWWHFKSIGNMDCFSYPSTMETPCSWPIIDETNKRFCNLGLKVKDNMLWDLSFSYLLKNERNPFEIPHTSFLMLNASNDNFKQQQNHHPSNYTY